MNQSEKAVEQWLQKKQKFFPKTAKASLELENRDVQACLGHGVQFIRAPFRLRGYCIFGFKTKFDLALFCKKFAEHLVSD